MILQRCCGGWWVTILFGPINATITNVANQTPVENSWAVVVLSSGEHTQSVFGNTGLNNIINNLNNQSQFGGVVIHTVAVGNPTLANRNRLNNLSEISGGAAVQLNQEGLDILINYFSNRQGFIDTDGDGLPDIVEQMIARGEIFLDSGELMPGYNLLCYLNPDCDDDGLLDGEEIEIRYREIDGEIRPYIFMHSLPTFPDSDMDGIPDHLDPFPFDPHDSRFMFVNDPAYRPHNSEVHDNWVKSELSHNTGTLETYPDFITVAKLREFQFRARSTVLGARVVGFFNAAAGLNHFLSNIGGTHYVNIRSMLDIPNGRNNFNRNMNYFMRAAEQMIMDGATKTIASVDQGNSKHGIRLWALGGTAFSFKNEKRVSQEGYPTGNWYSLLHDATAAVVGTVSRNGDSYTATVNYFLDDNYHWKTKNEDDESGGGLVKNWEMSLLHLYGWAREFRTDGYVRGITITWERGQQLGTDNAPFLLLP
jgi:hypothetical protein